MSAQSARSIMWLTILLDASVKGVIVLTAAGVLSVALRRASAASRHLVWSLALVSLIGLPMLSAVLPSWQVPILPRPVQTPQSNLDQGRSSILPDNSEIPERAETAAVPVGTGYSNAAPGAMMSETATPSLAGVEPMTRTRARLPWPVWIFLAWVIGSVGTIMPLLIGIVAVLGRTRRAVQVTEGACAGLLAELSDELGVRRRVRLLESDDASVPTTWGLLRPVVLLPSEARNWSEERCRMVLLHELAHIRRRDWLTQTLGRVACAVHWFNPLVWLAARRLRLESEQACDDALLRAGYRASGYAHQLLELVRTLRPARCASLATVPMARSSRIEKRLTAILDATRNRRALTHLSIALALIVVSCTVMPLAALRPTARNAQAEEPSLAPEPAPAPEREELLKHIGLALKIYAGENNGHFPPKVADPHTFHPETDAFVSLLEGWQPKYVEGPYSGSEMVAYLTGQRGVKVCYLGYVVTNEEFGLALLEELSSYTDEELPHDVYVSRAEGGYDTIYMLREGIERFLITDINNPAASAMTQSIIPVVWEIPDPGDGDGGWVLYMDGHVEWKSYPGEFPMTETFIARLREVRASPVEAEAAPLPRASFARTVRATRPAATPVPTTATARRGRMTARRRPAPAARTTTTAARAPSEPEEAGSVSAASPDVLAEMAQLLADPDVPKFELEWCAEGREKMERVSYFSRVRDVETSFTAPPEAATLAGPMTRYARLEFDDSGKTSYLCGIRKSPEGWLDYDVFFIDLDGDGALSENEILQGNVEQTPDGYLDCHYGTLILNLQDEVGPRKHEVHFWRRSSSRSPDLESRFYVQSWCHMAGQVRLADEEVAVMLIDYDCNGRYNTVYSESKDVDRIAFDFNGDGTIQWSELQYVGSYVPYKGDAYRIAVSPDGRKAALTPATPACGQLQFIAQEANVRIVGPRGPINVTTGDHPVPVPAGTYDVTHWLTKVEDNEGQIWRLSASSGYADRPFKTGVQVESDTTTEVVIGPPFSGSLAAEVKEEEGFVRFRWGVEGVGGGFLYVRGADGTRPPPPTITIRNSANDVIYTRQMTRAGSCWFGDTWAPAMAGQYSAAVTCSDWPVEVSAATCEFELGAATGILGARREARPLTGADREIFDELVQFARIADRRFSDIGDYRRGAALYHVRSENEATVWEMLHLRRRRESGPEEVNWGSSRRIDAEAEYHLPDGTPLKSRWEPRGDGMHNIYIDVASPVPEGERVPVVSRHPNAPNQFLVIPGTQERRFEFWSWTNNPAAWIVRLDAPLELGGFTPGGPDVWHKDDYTELTWLLPPDPEGARGYVNFTVPGGGVGFEIFDRSPLGGTDFVQRVNYERALNGELGRTISSLDYVRSARVRVTIPQAALFEEEQEEPTASVLLELAEPGALERHQVDAIRHLVAAGVEDLKESNIAVVDIDGNILAAPGDDTKADQEASAQSARPDKNQPARGAGVPRRLNLPPRS